MNGYLGTVTTHELCPRCEGDLRVEKTEGDYDWLCRQVCERCAWSGEWYCVGILIATLAHYQALESAEHALRPPYKAPSVPKGEPVPPKSGDSPRQDDDGAVVRAGEAGAYMTREIASRLRGRREG